jgi:CubicO group peptidase (beta-lactamase class C family)
MRRHLMVVALVAAATVAGPSLAGVTKIGAFRIEYKGKDIGPYTNLDTAVMQYMTQNDVHAAQLAVRNKGALVFSHAYTMGAGDSTVKTTNTFRLASISKMLVTAAYSQLLNDGKLTGSEKVYAYLGITKPLLKSQTVDSRSASITVQELYAHTSGLPGSGTGDPLFEMRDIEVQFGHAPLTAKQFAQYLYGLHLNSNPGQTATYSNVGYLLLSQIIAKASGMEYATYVQKSLLKPLKLKNWTLSPTSQANADANEIFADDPYTGPSVFDITQNAPTDPFNFEGGDIIWELTAGPTDYVTNAESVSSFIHSWAVYGLGGRQYDYARDGCMPGASTWAESLNPDVDFALLFNNQPCLDFSIPVIQQIESILAPL